MIDRSGVGEAVLDELRDLPSVEGASFSMEKKAEYLTHLRIKMEQRQFRMPYDRGYAPKSTNSNTNTRRLESYGSGTPPTATTTNSGAWH